MPLMPRVEGQRKLGFRANHRGEGNITQNDLGARIGGSMSYEWKLYFVHAQFCKISTLHCLHYVKN